MFGKSKKYPYRGTFWQMLNTRGHDDEC